MTIKIDPNIINDEDAFIEFLESIENKEKKKIKTINATKGNSFTITFES